MEPFTAVCVTCVLFNFVGIIVGVRWGYLRGTEDAEINCGKQYAQRERERLIYSRN